MPFIRRFFSRFGWGGVMSDQSGQQLETPSSLVAAPMSPDIALQISTVYACARLLAGTVSSLPLMVFKEDSRGNRKVDRGSRLWTILHDHPNSVMTASDFWQAMILQWALRGNAYAQIMRDSVGDVISLWPLSSDQMTVFSDKQTGRLVYQYVRDSETYDLTPDQVLHIKDIGTGILGFSKLEFMGSSVQEAMATQKYTMQNAQNFGRPSGILTVDHVLDRKKRQHDLIGQALGNFKSESGKMIVLEADMKFQQVALTPEQSQLLESRKYGVEEICRWFGVPPVLIGASGATTWGSGIAEIVAGFHKFTLNPLLKSIEQALESRILRAEERGSVVIEFNLDAFFRGDLQSRYAAYATAVQNGFKTRNEVRALENDPPIEGGDTPTAQTNLAPLDKLGEVASSNAPQTPVGDVKQ
nr:MAG TPA: portal protein [Caudoviricetes sp.]